MKTLHNSDILKQDMPTIAYGLLKLTGSTLQSSWLFSDDPKDFISPVLSLPMKAQKEFSKMAILTVAHLSKLPTYNKEI